MDIEGGVSRGANEAGAPGRSDQARRVLLNPRSGEVTVVAGAAPNLDPGSVLIQTAFSVISPGTERSKLELASNSLLGKARSRPDLMKKVIEKARREGLRATTVAVKRQLQEPMTLGYSLAGIVLAVGANVRDIRPGDRVAAGGGGYAIHSDVVAVPQNLVVRVPENLALDQAAMTTLGSVGMHGFRLAGVQVGETVVVMGLGLIGLLAALVAKAGGCRVIGSDLSEAMIARARDLGIQSVEASSLEAEVQKETKGRGADAVLVCAATRNAGPVESAGKVARDRAKIVVVGIVPFEAPRELFYEKELEVVVSRSYGPGRYDPSFEEHGNDYPIGYVRWTEQRNMESFLELLAQGLVNIEPLIRERYPVQDAATAYEKVKNTAGSIALLEFDQVASATRTQPSRPPARTVPTTGTRVGLIGTGSFASRILVPAMKKGGATLVAVVAQQGRRPPWAEETGSELLPSPEALLARDDIDAVFIASRHDSHAGLTVAALQAGKSVFVEKPLALSREELDNVVVAYNASDRHVRVGFNRRFAPLTTELVSHLRHRSGPAFISMRVNAGPLPGDHWLNDPEVGGGRILGEMCHFVDLGNFLIGSTPTRVMAAPCRVPGESPQTSQNIGASFEFADGSVVQVAYVSSGEPVLGKERVEVFFDGKTFVIDDWKGFTVASGGKTKTSSHSPDKGHNAEVASFLQLLSGRGSDDFDLTVGSSLATIAVIESASLGMSVDL